MRDPNVGPLHTPIGVQGKASGVARDLTALGGVSRSFLQSNDGSVPPLGIAVGGAVLRAVSCLGRTARGAVSVVEGFRIAAIQPD